VQHAEPWKEKDQETLSNILYTLAESLRLIALFLYPFMPSTAQKIWEQLDIPDGIPKSDLATEAEWGKSQPGTTISKGTALFPRIEMKPK
jgi:methionyl-tRNA synthetase